MILHPNNILEIWQDGELRDFKSSGGYSGNGLFNLGRELARSYQHFQGQIDDVRIYNYALTETQIKTLYNFGAARFGLTN